MDDRADGSPGWYAGLGVEFLAPQGWRKLEHTVDFATAAYPASARVPDVEGRGLIFR